MKLKQRNLLLFLGGSAGELALNFAESITLPALMPHALPFLCRSQSLLFVLAGQISFQVVRALMPLKTANLTPIQQIEYRTHEAVADLVHQTLLIEVKLGDSRGKNKDYKTGENQKYLAINFDHIVPCLKFQLSSK